MRVFVSCAPFAMIKIVVSACAKETFTQSLWRTNISTILISLGATMQNDEQLIRILEANNAKLTEINTNMLKVFWIVAVFALLYFGLMLYLLFL